MRSKDVGVLGEIDRLECELSESFSSIHVRLGCSSWVYAREGRARRTYVRLALLLEQGVITPMRTDTTTSVPASDSVLRNTKDPGNQLWVFLHR